MEPLELEDELLLEDVEDVEDVEDEDVEDVELLLEEDELLLEEEELLGVGSAPHAVRLAIIVAK